MVLGKEDFSSAVYSFIICPSNTLQMSVKILMPVVLQLMDREQRYFETY